MKEELKEKLELLLWGEVGVADYDSLTDKIADLIDQDQQETRNKINDASIKLVVIVDEIKAVLNPQPKQKAEEVRL